MSSRHCGPQCASHLMVEGRPKPRPRTSHSTRAHNDSYVGMYPFRTVRGPLMEHAHQSGALAEDAVGHGDRLRKRLGDPYMRHEEGMRVLPPDMLEESFMDSMPRRDMWITQPPSRARSVPMDPPDWRPPRYQGPPNMRPSALQNVHCEVFRQHPLAQTPPASKRDLYDLRMAPDSPGSSAYSRISTASDALRRRGSRCTTPSVTNLIVRGGIDYSGHKPSMVDLALRHATAPRIASSRASLHGELRGGTRY